jgi:DNA-binding Lrp family transcriptional regulator
MSEATPDRIDRELLRLLSKNARASNKELAAAVGLSPSSCHARVARLSERGWLRGFHASVDPEALGITLQAIVFVRVVRHSKALLEPFRAHVRELPEVLDLYYVAGSHDILIRVAVSSVEHLRRLVADQLSTQDAVGHIETSLVFEHYHEPVLPDYRHE